MLERFRARRFRRARLLLVDAEHYCETREGMMTERDERRLAKAQRRVDRRSRRLLGRTSRLLLLVIAACLLPATAQAHKPAHCKHAYIRRHHHCQRKEVHHAKRAHPHRQVQLLPAQISLPQATTGAVSTTSPLPSLRTAEPNSDPFRTATPSTITDTAVVSEETYATPIEECEPELIAAHRCARLLVGSVTITGVATPAAYGYSWIDAGVAACGWIFGAECVTGGWSPLTLYVWRTLPTRYKAHTGLTTYPRLPLETEEEQETAKLSGAWATLFDGALSGTFEAQALFRSTDVGYVVSEPLTEWRLP